jgi:hypothetical protein
MMESHKGHKAVSFGCFLAVLRRFDPLWGPYAYALTVLMASDTFAFAIYILKMKIGTRWKAWKISPL